jgi:hypothetical protein
VRASARGGKKGKGNPAGVIVLTGVDDLFGSSLTEREPFVNVAVKPVLL